jgi:DNA-binding CsgD family transcriptional regulator
MAVKTYPGEMPRKRKPRVRTQPTKREATLSVRELDALKMRASGKSQDEIANALGVTQQRVSQILARLDDNAAAEKRLLSHRHKIRQHFVLEWAQREAQEAWYRSIGKHQKSTVSQKTIPATAEDGKSTTQMTTERTTRLETEELVGNPAFLAQAIAASQAIIELWGYKAPVKVQASRETSEFEELADAALLELAQREFEVMRKQQGAIDADVLRRDGTDGDLSRDVPDAAPDLPEGSEDGSEMD